MSCEGRRLIDFPGSTSATIQTQLGGSEDFLTCSPTNNPMQPWEALRSVPQNVPRGRSSVPIIYKSLRLGY